MPDSIEALARLVAAAGVNVSPGQTVVLRATLGQEQLAREVVGASYELGAQYVDVAYGDPHVRRVRLTRAPEAALGQLPPWRRRFPLDVEQAGGAMISLSGPVAPHLLDDVDPGRIGRDQVALPEQMEVIARQRMRWTIAPGPTAGWARLVFGDDDPEALAKLWAQVATICRLDADDPVAAWRTRSAELGAAAARLTDAELDSLHFRGPGTDLTVGLLPGARWEGGGMTSVDGIGFLPNIPTEEVFTTPDPERTEGTVSSTKPLLVSGRTITGLRMRFEAGHAVRIDADEGTELIRELAARDEHASRLGEVALVDASSRVGRSGLVFHDTLFDENAASHIAIGGGFPHLVDDAGAGRVNESGVHTDFMIGGPEIEVIGTTRDGRELPVLMHQRWAL